MSTVHVLRKYFSIHGCTVHADNISALFVELMHTKIILKFVELLKTFKNYINPYPTAFPYGNGMVLHFYQQQESSTTKTVHKVINKGLKTYV